MAANELPFYLYANLLLASFELMKSKEVLLEINSNRDD